MILAKRVNDTFKKRASSISYNIGSKSGFDPKVVDKKVFGEFSIKVIEEIVTCESEDKDNPEKENHHSQVYFIAKVE